MSLRRQASGYLVARLITVERVTRHHDGNQRPYHIADLSTRRVIHCWRQDPHDCFKPGSPAAHDGPLGESGGGTFERRCEP